MFKVSLLFRKSYAPRWLILQIDIFLSILSILIAYVLYSSFSYVFKFDTRFIYVVTFFTFVRTIIFLFTKTYSGIIRYTSIHDAKRIFYATSIGTVIFATFYTIYAIVSKEFYLPLPIIIIEYISILLLMTSFRIFIKIFYHEFIDAPKRSENVIIYGSGASGMITKRTIDQDSDLNYQVIAFIDDNPSNHGRRLEGIPIISSEIGLGTMIKQNSVKSLIIAIQNITRERKTEIIEKCLDNNVKVKIVPPTNDWINGELSSGQIKSMRIEDLLMRESIQLDRDKIAEQIKGKVILITGAAGSIGSEVTRQLVQFYPEKIILFDQAETPLYELELELEEKYGFINFHTCLGDITSKKVVEKVLSEFRPDFIYHAAAYKHVPLMESNPCEAIMVNVNGTKFLAELAVKYEVGKFVMISTDKAVNPNNVMGSSKRIAEIYIQALHTFMKNNYKVHKTSFITTRFGNVLASNGSVIPRFRKQIQSGGPVTVTHPEVSRYFMTIDEASQLILEAGAMGKGGEIYIFDMGNPVRIVDLARKMIRFSGYIPDKDIQIKFIGLRPGEKIREELLDSKEDMIPTHHEKILIAKVIEYDYSNILDKIEKIIELAKVLKSEEVLIKMNDLVKENCSRHKDIESIDIKVNELKQPKG